MSEDTLQAELSRIAMLPDKTMVEDAISYHLGKPPFDFNRALARGTKLAVGEKRPLFFLSDVVASKTYPGISAVIMYVNKQQPERCNCGETPDSMYVAVQPPTNPEIWNLYLNDSRMDPDQNVHQGLLALVSDLSSLVLKEIRKRQKLRFQAQPPAASIWAANTWVLPVHITGYGFGGAMATIMAIQLQKLGKDIELHLTTFGSPAVTRAGVGSRLHVRRFAHARDPITRLFDGFEHIGPALEDADTQVEVASSIFGEKFAARRAEACQDMSCHTAYLGVDFRDAELLKFYAKVPRGIALSMLPHVKGGVEELWTLAVKESRILTAEGDIPCAWSMVVQQK
jgi:hypothetical protein